MDDYEIYRDYQNALKLENDRENKNTMVHNV